MVETFIRLSADPRRSISKKCEHASRLTSHEDPMTPHCPICKKSIAAASASNPHRPFLFAALQAYRPRQLVGRGLPFLAPCRWPRSRRRHSTGLERVSSWGELRRAPLLFPTVLLSRAFLLLAFLLRFTAACRTTASHGRQARGHAWSRCHSAQTGHSAAEQTLGRFRDFWLAFVGPPAAAFV